MRVWVSNACVSASEETVLQCTAVYCSVLLHCFSVLQCVAICEQCVALSCIVLHWVALGCSVCLGRPGLSRSRVLQCVAVSCSVLRDVAGCCNIMQHVCWQSKAIILKESCGCHDAKASYFHFGHLLCLRESLAAPPLPFFEDPFLLFFEQYLPLCILRPCCRP